ncbi:hypothetical protein L1887_17913 [Cichorium endivia]|nr:hypothetical protein L1887_17913 [Cichorium endivia]
MRPPIATVTVVYSTSISVDEVSADEVSAAMRFPSLLPPLRVLHFRREIVAKFLNPAGYDFGFFRFWFGILEDFGTQSQNRW